MTEDVRKSPLVVLLSALGAVTLGWVLGSLALIIWAGHTLYDESERHGTWETINHRGSP